MNLENLTDEELHAELLRRKEEKEARENEERRERRQLVLAHRDVLLELVPNHDRASCGSNLDEADENLNNSGYHPQHGGGYCARCNLLSLNEWDDDVNVIFDLKFSKKVRKNS